MLSKERYLKLKSERKIAHRYLEITKASNRRMLSTDPMSRSMVQIYLIERYRSKVREYQMLTEIISLQKELFKATRKVADILTCPV